MQEYSVSLMPMLLGGLSPRGRYKRNSRFVEDIYGQLPEQDRLIPFPADSAYASVAGTPFPQIYRGRGLSLYALSTILREANYDDDTFTNITFYDPSAPATVVPLTAAGRWHIAEGLDTWFAFNGVMSAFRTGLANLAGTGKQYFAQSRIRIQSGCEHRGRFVVGGLTAESGVIFPSAITELLNGVTLPAGVDPSFLPDDMSNFVMWSSVGGGDLPLWLFFPESGFTYDLSPTEEDVIFRIKRNELGWMPMRFTCDVLAVHPLREHVVVYTTNGVAALTLAEGTYSYQELSPIGVPSRDSVAVFDSYHTYINNDGDLTVIDNRLQSQKLGYRNHLRALSLEDIVLFADPTDPRVFISDTEDSYVLQISADSVSLSRSPQHIYSGIEWKGTRKMTRENVGDLGLTIRTSPFNFGSTSIKTFNVARLSYQSPVPLSVRAWYRHELNQAWQEGPTVPVNKEGNAYVRVAGVEFKLDILADDYTGIEISDLEASYHLSDRRFHRGPSVGTPTPETGSGRLE